MLPPPLMLLLLASSCSCLADHGAAFSQPQPKSDPQDDTGFYFAADTGFYPPSPSTHYGLTDPNYLGFDLQNLVTTGLSVLAGIVLLTFAMTFFSNVLGAILDSPLVEDLLDRRRRRRRKTQDGGDDDDEEGRAIRAEMVADVAEKILQAYNKYNAE